MVLIRYPSPFLFATNLNTYLIYIFDWRTFSFLFGLGISCPNFALPCLVVIEVNSSHVIGGDQSRAHGDWGHMTCQTSLATIKYMAQKEGKIK